MLISNIGRLIGRLLGKSLSVSATVVVICMERYLGRGRRYFDIGCDRTYLSHGRRWPDSLGANVVKSTVFWAL